SDNVNGAHAVAWGPVTNNRLCYKANAAAAGANAVTVTVTAASGVIRLIASHFRGLAAAPLVTTSTNEVTSNTAWTAGTTASVAAGQLVYVSWGIDSGTSAAFGVGAADDLYGWM